MRRLSSRALAHVAAHLWLAIVCGTTLVCLAPLTRFAQALETVGIVLFIVGLATIGASIARAFG